VSQQNGKTQGVTNRGSHKTEGHTAGWSNTSVTTQDVTTHDVPTHDVTTQDSPTEDFTT